MTFCKPIREKIKRERKKDIERFLKKNGARTTSHISRFIGSSDELILNLLREMEKENRINLILESGQKRIIRVWALS